VVVVVGTLVTELGPIVVEHITSVIVLRCELT